MRKALIATLALMLAATFALPALASAPDKGQKVSGTIANVDVAAGSVTIQTANRENVTCIVDAQTTIRIGGETAALPDLKVGQNVTMVVQAGKALAIDVRSQ